MVELRLFTIGRFSHHGPYVALMLTEVRSVKSHQRGDWHVPVSHLTKFSFGLVMSLHCLGL